MRITSLIFALFIIIGCNDDKPTDSDVPDQRASSSTEEPDVPDAQSSSRSDESDSPTLSMFDISAALSADEMPQFLQDQLKETPPIVTIAEFQSIDAQAQKEVITAIEKAIAHYRQQASRRRAGHTPAQSAAADLEAFLEAAVQQ